MAPYEYGLIVWDDWLVMAYSAYQNLGVTGHVVNEI